MSYDGQTRKRPLWVKVALWGLPSRVFAWGFFWLAICVAVACVVKGFSDQRYFLGGPIMALAGLWYFAAIKWVDLYGRWSQPSAEPNAAADAAAPDGSGQNGRRLSAALPLSVDVRRAEVDYLMLPLDDLRWQSYKGGYRVPYDASPALRRLLADGPDEELWEEFWNELHHQGDLHQASYAAVPWLVEFVRRSPKLDWNALALIATIELERGECRNPTVANELSAGYDAAIRSLPNMLGSHPDQEWSELVVRSAVACIAMARGHRWYARAYLELDRDTAGRWFSEEFGWDFPDAEPGAPADPAS